MVISEALRHISLLVELVCDLVYEALCRPEQVKVLDLYLLDLILDGLKPLEVAHLVLVISIVLHIFCNLAHQVYDVLGEVDSEVDLSLLTQVLTDGGLLDVGGVFGALGVFQKVEWKHASSELLGVFIILKSPLHVRVTFVLVVSWGLSGVARTMTFASFAAHSGISLRLGGVNT